MASDPNIVNLRKAFRDNNLTLYLGAGVSVANGLPSWDQLVLSMYYSAIEAESQDRNLRPFPNYLYAIAEWHLERRREPLDIKARKIRRMYNSEDFLALLKNTLYGPFKIPGNDTFQTPDLDRILAANQTLASVAKLCSKEHHRQRKIKGVITYNYDDLLEIALQRGNTQSIWKASQEIENTKLPIYHVHGYVPLHGEGSTEEEIIFTEEQYYLASHNAYAWSNLVQLKYLSSSVGLMIGMSLTDRNVRRLLDALRMTPMRAENYILLKRPRWPQLRDEEVADIDVKAREYYRKFTRSGIKRDERRDLEIKKIIKAVEKRDVHEEEITLESLGDLNRILCK